MLICRTMCKMDMFSRLHLIFLIRVERISKVRIIYCHRILRISQRVFLCS